MPASPAELREAEVQDLHDGFASHEHVAGLDVAVNDVQRVDALEAPRDLGSVVERRRGGERPAIHDLPKRLALVASHGDEQLPVGSGVDVVNRADVGMIHGRCRPRLPQEARLQLLVAAPTRRKELERHHPSELRVARLVDIPHAAAAEALEKLVVPDGSRSHSRSRKPDHTIGKNREIRTITPAVFPAGGTRWRRSVLFGPERYAALGRRRPSSSMLLDRRGLDPFSCIWSAPGTCS